MAEDHASSHLTASHVLRRPTGGHPDTIEIIGTNIAFATNAQVYGEGEPSIYLYKIITGLARCYRMTLDGRRQIVAFYVPGDVFGFEAGDRHTLSVEIITESRVCIIKRSSALNAIARDEGFSRELWLSFSREVRRNQEHILQFGKSAQTRVASFLLEMLRRVPAASTKALPISRQDIADYLDLRIETVSRAMTRLAKNGAIAPSSRRRITIRNPAALNSLFD
jgi:CRP-like cAMP-binding protein